MKNKYNILVRKLSVEDCRELLSAVTMEISRRDRKKRVPTIHFKLKKALYFLTDTGNIEDLSLVTRREAKTLTGFGDGLADYAEKLLKKKGLKFKEETIL